MRANPTGFILGAVTILGLAGWMILRPGFFHSGETALPPNTDAQIERVRNANAPPDAGAAAAASPAPGEGSASSGSGALGVGAPNPGASGLNTIDQRKVAVLTEILTSKNDNDPRMDTELRDFSPAVKAAIQKKYAELEPEKRNARGTMVFLLGREIKDPSELPFFKSVLQEKPCLSLENCDKTPGGHSGEEEHLEAINETTANYPQLLAVRALAHRANDLVDTGQEGSPLYSAILLTLKEALQSPNPKVVEAAGRALEELKRE
jgi:hypothetical protein